VVKTTVTPADIAAGPGVDVLRRVFLDPDSLMAERTREKITRATVGSVARDYGN
jgi:hypothetical protein